MSVLGFDIGNENCVIAAAVKQKGVDVLLNDESKRETPAVVSFGEKQRFFGSSGAACATMYTKSTISQVKRLIGRNFDHPDVQKDLKLLPFETSKASGGGVLIHLDYLGKKEIFSPVQILAMIFSHWKQTAEKNLEVHVSECVMGIPSYFTDLQRRLYLDAADIAGLKVLRLMHDCTATALGYGIYRTDNPKLDPSFVVFVDVGHSDTQVSIVSIESEHMKTLSHAFDSNLGARDFDDILFCHFAAKFMEQYNIDVHSSVRACIRLRAACEKLKKVLSANPEAPLLIECLMDEKDVKGFITRVEFEKLSSDLLYRILIPCHKALSHSGLTKEMIHSVELVGSGSRIPAVGRILASYFEIEPRRTLNASECVARGCALQCAILSPTFRVKEYEVEDSLPFSVRLIADDGPIQSLQNDVLFREGHSIPSEKVLTLQKSNTFQMEAFYADEKELPSGVSSEISVVVIGPLPASETENTVVKVKARLTVHGTVTLASASLVGVHADEMRRRGKMSEERVESACDYRSPHTGNGEDGRCFKHFKPSSGSSTYRKKSKAMPPMKIPINEIICGRVSAKELSDAVEKEAELAQQDFNVEQAKERKNSLESYVYDMRNKILSAYRDFAKDIEKDGISEKLQQTEDWLYEDGEDESANVYAERLQNLEKLIDPIERRYRDEEPRAHAARELSDNIREYQTDVKHDKSLPARKKEAILSACASCEQWLREMTQLQDSRPKNEDPVLWSFDIEEEIEALPKRLNHIIKSKSSPEPDDDDSSSEGDDMNEDSSSDVV